MFEILGFSLSAITMHWNKHSCLCIVLHVCKCFLRVDIQNLYYWVCLSSTILDNVKLSKVFMLPSDLWEVFIVVVVVVLLSCYHLKLPVFILAIYWYVVEYHYGLICISVITSKFENFFIRLLINCFYTFRNHPHFTSF